LTCRLHDDAVGLEVEVLETLRVGGFCLLEVLEVLEVE